MGAALLVVVLVAAGCGRGEGRGDEPPSPDRAAGLRRRVAATQLAPFVVDPAELGGPGSPLGGGLVVPPGAVLLGAPVADLVSGGHRSLLLVTGASGEVFDALREQAAALGLARSGGCRGDEQRFSCAAHLVADAPSGPEADAGALTLRLVRQVGAGGVVSALALHHWPPGAAPLDGPPDVSSAPTVATGSEAVLPTRVGPPPDDDVVAALAAPGSPPVRVELGSVLLGLPGPCTCAAGGWSFLVSITGVVPDVVAAYARQFSALGKIPNTTVEHVDDRSVLAVRVGDGDRYAEVLAVETDDGPAFALVSGVGI